MHGCRVNFTAVLQQLPLLNPSTFQSLSAYTTKTGNRIRFLGLSLITPTQIYHPHKSHELICEYGPTFRFPVAGRSLPIPALGAVCNVCHTASPLRKPQNSYYHATKCHKIKKISHNDNPRHNYTAIFLFLWKHIISFQRKKKRKNFQNVNQYQYA